MSSFFGAGLSFVDALKWILSHLHMLSLATSWNLQPFLLEKEIMSPTDCRFSRPSSIHVSFLICSSLLPRFGAHANPFVWGEAPESFKPSRSVDLTKFPKHAWMPFGNGGRICIGKVCFFLLGTSRDRD